MSSNTYGSADHKKRSEIYETLNLFRNLPCPVQFRTPTHVHLTLRESQKQDQGQLSALNNEISDSPKAAIKKY